MVPESGERVARAAAGGRDEREDAIYAELETSLAAQMPEALALLREVQRLPREAGSPARQVARRMEHALQDAKGKKRKRGRKR